MSRERKRGLCNSNDKFVYTATYSNTWFRTTNRIHKEMNDNYKRLMSMSLASLFPKVASRDLGFSLKLHIPGA